MIFSKTTLLSIKVNTLICFHSMVKILDKFTLTEKLVPLLARIKTKEPAVMIATLAVHEEMGKKVEITAIATLILPQLWGMSIGPLLNLDQFKRFMNSIDQLSKRVREEHAQQLLEAKRLQESTAATHTSTMTGTSSGEVDFETLVKGGNRGHQTTGAVSNGTSRTARANQIEYDGFSTPTDLSNASPTFSAWGLDETPKVNNNHRPPFTATQQGWNSTTSINSSSNPTSASASIRTSSTTFMPGSFGSPIAPPPQQHSANPMGHSANPMMMNSSMINPTHISQPPPRPSSTSNVPYSFTQPTQSLSQGMMNNSNNNMSSSMFVGLPPLQPQSSSLAHMLDRPTSVVSWNVVPPQPPKGGKGLTKEVGVADFDPFA